VPPIQVVTHPCNTVAAGSDIQELPDKIRTTYYSTSIILIYKLALLFLFVTEWQLTLVFMHFLYLFCKKCVYYTYKYIKKNFKGD